MTATPRSTPQIRLAKPADAAALAGLARALLAHEESVNGLPFHIQPWAASSAELRKQIQQPDTRFFIAEQNEQIVGYLKVVVHGLEPADTNTSWQHHWKLRLVKRGKDLADWLFQRPRANVTQVGGYIAGAYVLPEWRRSHVGRALVIAAESWLRKNGLPTSELHVLYDNASAREFWASLGYEPLALSLRKKLLPPTD